MQSQNIREVMVFEIDSKIRPGDNAILREVGGCHDYLANQLIELSEGIMTVLGSIRASYYRAGGTETMKNKQFEQMFTSMITGRGYVAI